MYFLILNDIFVFYKSRINFVAHTMKRHTVYDQAAQEQLAFPLKFLYATNGVMILNYALCQPRICALRGVDFQCPNKVLARNVNNVGSK